MAPATVQSAYTTRQRADSPVPNYELPNSNNYAAPPVGSPMSWGIRPVQPYAERLREAPGETPDPMRLQHMPTLNDQAPPAEPPTKFYGEKDSDKRRRWSVEYLHADGWKETKQRKGKSPDPRWIPSDEPRPTQQMAPVSWIYTRPFDQNIKRNLNGTHFSMADHKRMNYSPAGLAPVASRRNTFRVDPTPWDVNQLDMPADGSGIPSAQIPNVNLPPSMAAGNRSWRL